jgi:hypothetical protein
MRPGSHTWLLHRAAVFDALSAWLRQSYAAELLGCVHPVHFTPQLLVVWLSEVGQALHHYASNQSRSAWHSSPSCCFQTNVSMVQQV